MRFLITCISGHSHFHSMVPIAAAARRHGHEVIFATAAEMSSLVEGAGFRLEPCGPSRLRIRTELQRTGESSSDHGLPQPGPGNLFGAVVPRLRLPGLLDVVHRVVPDAVISESLDLAGPMAAELSGIQSFVQSIGPYHNSTTEELRDAVEPLYRQELGRTPAVQDIVEPYIDICPSELQSQAVQELSDILPVMLPTYHGTQSSAEPTSTARSGDHRLLISFGTVSNHALDEYHTVARTLAEQGWEVTLTVGPRGWFDWTTRPDSGERRLVAGVRLVDYVPLDTELPTTHLLIHHGGSNTLRAAIEHTVPALVIPQEKEQGRNARWIADQGLGVLLQPAEATPANVAAACRQLIDDDRISQRLVAARDAWLGMPSEEALLKVIGTRVATRKGHL